MPFVDVVDLEPTGIDWLWPGRLARGHLDHTDTGNAPALATLTWPPLPAARPPVPPWLQ
jgi:hypothetical protein